uniref:Secreted protein n=1 Tax=Saccharum spontaneum TaxID=62335 RepID=A0A678T6A8_SACSP|nr:hypothetical protein SS32B07_000005 [Saccharum spontaneum]
MPTLQRCLIPLLCVCFHALANPSTSPLPRRWRWWRLSSAPGRDVDWQHADEWTRSSVIDANLMQGLKISIAVISQTDAAVVGCLWSGCLLRPNYTTFGSKQQDNLIVL